MCVPACPLVSIVILNYNGKQFLEKCLTSIFNQSFSNFEIVFVDNASVDESVNYVKAQFGHDTRLKIVENKSNSGPIDGNNIGIRLVNRQTAYIVLLNNDTELTPNWLSCMVNAMENDPKIGAACSKQLLMDDHKKLQGFGSYIDPCGFSYQLGEYEVDTGQYNGATLEIFTAGTTALFLKTDLLSRIGLLDSKYDHGFDDVDLCWRVWLSGYKVVCVSRCIIYHKVGGTTRRVDLARVLFHREKNRIMTAIKNYSVLYQFRFLPLILSFDLLQLMWFVGTNNFSMFWSIIRALVWDIKHFKYMWTQHLTIKYNIRRISDKQIRSHMLKINLMELWRRIGSIST
jgi:GT2 family glycosyltransferase